VIHAGATLRTRLGRRSAVLAIAGLCLAAALPAGSGAATRAPLSQRSTLQLPGPAAHFPDTLIRGRRVLERADGTGPHETVFPVLGGEHVTMSSAYYTDAQMQSIADVLGGLVHGQEMNTLSVYVASPDEITGICGSGALACYAPSISEMVVSGVDGSASGVPRDYTIAHEYGHHIANNRDNSPWTAIETGAKRWATYEHVCQGTRQGQLYPGDEGSHYWDNPGEGFAETNAHMNFPGVSVPWGYSELLQPSQASMAKLRADITTPWTGPSTVTWDGSMWPSRHNPAEHRFSTPLDGQVEIRLSGPAGSNYDLYLLGPKVNAEKRARKRHDRRSRHRKVRVRRVIDRAVTGDSQEQIDLGVCGQSSIQVEVRRVSGSGPFSVSVTRP
jgi:hypothetical protein